MVSYPGSVGKISPACRDETLHSISTEGKALFNYRYYGDHQGSRSGAGDEFPSSVGGSYVSRLGKCPQKIFSASLKSVGRFSPFGIDKTKVIPGIGLAGIGSGGGTISRRPYSSGNTRASISNRGRQSFSSKSERTIRAFARPRARVTACVNCAKGRSPASPRRIHSKKLVSLMPLASHAVLIVQQSER